MYLIEFPASPPIVPLALRRPRAEGLHLSTVIHDLCETLEPERFSARATGSPEDSEEDTERLDLESVPIIYLGLAYEERLEHVLDLRREHDGRLSFRPDEMQYRGIWMNADRVVLDEPARDALPEPPDIAAMPLVEEHKLTKMSGNHDVQGPKFRHWWWQLMFYCAAFDTRRGRIRAFFVNGDYRFGKTPEADLRGRQYRVWDVVFTPQEIDDNVRMVLTHARKRGWL